MVHVQAQTNRQIRRRLLTQRTPELEVVQPATAEPKSIPTMALPAQTLTAKCIDPSRPLPKAGELYTLYPERVLKLQDGTKRYQRFRVSGGH